ncbi:hypothetical protein E6H30_07515 [Candidatus Bathyarchaeota archaeon]|nr:MAG: hypothetical protein E6H30_07515 [Candidatus Bathyarchaeota archaeon]
MISSRYARPVPLWVLLVAVILTASITARLTILPDVIRSKPDFAVSLTSNPLIVFAQNQDGNSTNFVVDSVRNFTGIVSPQWTTQTASASACLWGLHRYSSEKQE